MKKNLIILFNIIICIKLSAIDNVALYEPKMIFVNSGSYIVDTTMWNFKYYSDKKIIMNRNVKSFYASETQITVAMWDTFIKQSKYTPYEGSASAGIGPWYREHIKSIESPISCISMYDAMMYCNWLSKKNGFKEVYNISQVSKNKNSYNYSVSYDLSANGYRLPSEVEWEYAVLQGMKNTDGILKQIKKYEDYVNAMSDADRPFQKVPLAKQFVNDWHIYFTYEISEFVFPSIEVLNNKGSVSEKDTNNLFQKRIRYKNVWCVPVDLLDAYFAQGFRVVRTASK